MNTVQNPGSAVDSTRNAGQAMRSVCPSLILDHNVVCDAVKEIFQPSRRMIRESCTNEQHQSCPLRLMA